MPNVSPEILGFLTQAGFAGLFIWLLLRTQDRQDKREDRLINIIDMIVPKLDNVTRVLERIERKMDEER